MNIQINGENCDIRSGEILADVVKKQNPSNKRVAILLNDDLIPADKREGHILKQGDRVEILTFAGGG